MFSILQGGASGLTERTSEKQTSRSVRASTWWEATSRCTRSYYLVVLWWHKFCSVRPAVAQPRMVGPPTPKDVQETGRKKRPVSSFADEDHIKALPLCSVLRPRSWRGGSVTRAIFRVVSRNHSNRSRPRTAVACRSWSYRRRDCSHQYPKRRFCPPMVVLAEKCRL